MTKRVLKLFSITTAIYIYYIISSKYHIMLPCLFFRITGYLCPGCGITRCLICLTKGNFYQAFCYNKLFFLLMPFFIAYIFYSLYLYLFSKKDKILKNIPSAIWYLLLIIIILFGIVRNFI